MDCATLIKSNIQIQYSLNIVNEENYDAGRRIRDMETKKKCYSF